MASDFMHLWYLWTTHQPQRVVQRGLHWHWSKVCVCVCVCFCVFQGNLRYCEALSSDLQKNALAALLRLGAVRRVNGYAFSLFFIYNSNFILDIVLRYLALTLHIICRQPGLAAGAFLELLFVSLFCSGK